MRRRRQQRKIQGWVKPPVYPVQQSITEAGWFEPTPPALLKSEILEDEEAGYMPSIAEMVKPTPLPKSLGDAAVAAVGGIGAFTSLAIVGGGVALLYFLTRESPKKNPMGSAFGGEAPRVFIFSSKEKAQAFKRRAQDHGVRGSFSVRKTQGWSTYSLIFKPHSFSDVIDISNLYAPEKPHYDDIARDVA